MRIVSLFANIGVAEACFHELDNVKVVVANEWLTKRANLYHSIYPESTMICGDITDENIYQQILQSCRKERVDTIMATPPCQGMSTAGQKIKFDERHSAYFMIRIRKPGDTDMELQKLLFNVKDIPNKYWGNERMAFMLVKLNNLGNVVDRV